MKIKLPKWYDLHAHFRQGDIMPFMIKDHLAMGCAGILAMPNTKPPVAKVFKKYPLPYWSIEDYLEQLRQAGGHAFEDIIVPLYLTKDTTAAMIEDGAKSGLLRACKYYPPHGTTGAEHSTDFRSFIENGVFGAMAEAGIILCVHGEHHGMRPEDYFSRQTNAEEEFYRNHMPRLLDRHQKLRIVAEHLTTKTAVDLVTQTDNMAASITPQHLLYTIGHLLQGLKYHLYCMPLVKFEEDRQALREAVTASQNTKFFAGTDSAPHTKKATSCGCAAGCYTGGIAPQLYAQAFEMSGINLSEPQEQIVFENFLCRNGAVFYRLPVSKETFILEKKEQRIFKIQTSFGEIIPLPLGMQNEDTTQITAIPWCIASNYL
ncbi:MAG: dihydroorotase [Alphaproteobacteria bacterium CG_4_9_14_3_um_filter_47_13]|nr:MAG: dihydroorotase [Alphaproteobacteria bacterium CG_4_9_14_3_um_filter_47_13]